ncbi:hypothetical protein QM141_30430 [Klebsiella michiganensis]|nr:hypothetical protein [Klebsiella michiganensis]MDV5348572.1 hypothetical protein [Klebsiella michiganensis]
MANSILPVIMPVNAKLKSGELRKVFEVKIRRKASVLPLMGKSDIHRH